MNYAEKNKDKITFHKLMFFMEYGASAYRLKFVDMKVPDEDKEVFLLGRAIEDGLKYTQEEFEDVYDLVKRRTAKLKYGEKNKNGKYELNTTHQNYAFNCSKALFENKFVEYDKKNSSVNVNINYKGFKIGGEIDHLQENNGKYSIDDVKTCGDLLSYFKIIGNEIYYDVDYKFANQYLKQLSFYQFLIQVSKGIDNIEDISGRLFFVSKEKSPQSMTVKVTAQTLLEQRPFWLDGLDRLIEFHKNGFPEPTFADYLRLGISGIEGNLKQDEVITI